jgi:hypothetical protein
MSAVSSSTPKASWGERRTAAPAEPIEERAFLRLKTAAEPIEERAFLRLKTARDESAVAILVVEGLETPILRLITVEMRRSRRNKNFIIVKVCCFVLWLKREKSMRRNLLEILSS